MKNLLQYGYLVIAIIVGFYNIFVIMYCWNLFLVPIFGFPIVSYWWMFGISAAFWLLRDDRDCAEFYMKSTCRILEVCLPEEKMRDVTVVISSLEEDAYEDIFLSYFG